MSWTQSDQDRRLHGLVRIGKITEVDPAAGRARVHLGGDAQSAWLPWLAGRAGAIAEWAPLAVGEQVMVLAPGGDASQAAIIGSLFGGSNAAPSSDGAAWRLEMGGSSIEMTADAVTITAGGTTMTIDASGVDVNADVVADGVSLKAHTHPGDSGGTTGPPS